MNICSNQIKEVILHRFKVKTLQKLLIHINFLLAFSVLFCSHSAFGQQSVSTQWPQNNKWTIVDLGLSVYWADRNVDASNSGGYGKYFTWSEAKNWNKSTSNVTPKWGGDWRTPSQSELEELENLQHDHSAVKLGIRLITSSNNPSINTNFIDIPASGCYTARGSEIEIGSMAYLWSSTFIPPDHRYDPPRAYYLIYSRPTKVNVIHGNPDWKLPIRPVLDKCTNVTITVIYSDGTPSTTTTKSYPKGTTINITCGACYEYRCVEKNGSTERETNIISNSNVTYEVTFSTKTTNIRATTDSNKGWVGLSVWK